MTGALEIASDLLFLFGRSGPKYAIVACIALTGSAAFASVSAGYFYSCAVNTDGVAYCWGNNAYGQLGDGSTIDRRTPAVVADLRDIAAHTGIAF